LSLLNQLASQGVGEWLVPFVFVPLGTFAPFLPTGKQFVKYAGVYELRDEDEKMWYRVLYVHRADTVQVLHCFEKRSNSIEQKDIETAKTRLKRVLEAEREEKRNAKQAIRRR
jgi:Phage derived protein Gp49-like (DUF891)